ncbi:Haloacid dehalogenase [Lasiodiplodia theobromae]|uniref:Haloacid dehalogenase n=1 Tax=Lasiodiplodia theobromae TaxID=45133 RepID=UPI0015C2D9D1|nr:Haloacid dehalogenase [Lasiodiplodia theobromae]KAF4544269.1 Haloacid dehalogenase [Lasiodiplodia theobromae]
MPSFNTKSIVQETKNKPAEMAVDVESDPGVCPDAPKLSNAVLSHAIPYHKNEPSSKNAVKESSDASADISITRKPTSQPLGPSDPTAGLTGADLTHLLHPGIANVSAMTPATLSVRLPVLTLLSNPNTSVHTLHRALLTAHLRTNPLLLLPPAPDDVNDNGNGSIHLAANYAAAGLSAFTQKAAADGPDTPFSSTPLHPDDLHCVRRFTLLVPTHKGYFGDHVVKREQMSAFLFSGAVRGVGLGIGCCVGDDAVAPGGPDSGPGTADDPLVLEHRWFLAQTGKEKGEREVWRGIVRRAVRTLMAGMAKALFAEGGEGEEAREHLLGEVVFQEWCDGWGEKCGADVRLVREVRAVIAEMEDCYGSVLRGRLRVAEGTEGGDWGEVVEEEEMEEGWEEMEVVEVAEVAEMEG